MKISRFDPWAVNSEASGPAYDAYPAYSVDGIGRLGRIGIQPELDLGSFEERAAVIEFSGCQTRSQAELFAAQQAGFASPPDFHAALLADWCDRLDAASIVSAERRMLCDRAIRFCREWATQFVALGWDEVSMFSVNFAAPGRGGLVQTMNCRGVLAVTNTDAVLRDTKSGRLSRFSRFALLDQDLPLIWEIPN